MSDAQVEAVAESISADEAAFASLPPPLACLVFLALPPDARGRACCVCRAWRDALADPSLWTRLDLSFVRSTEYKRYDAERQRYSVVLHGAAARARGQLRQLSLSPDFSELDVLLPVLTSNAGSLRELDLPFVDTESTSDVDAVMAAAPLLQLLKSEHVWCKWEDASRVLRAEPPFAPLQMRRLLDLGFDGADDIASMNCFGQFATALADATLQPALSELYVGPADTAQPAVMGALVDAALARRLRKLTFEECTPLAAAPLARLLAEGSLVALQLCPPAGDFVTPQFDAAGAAQVADALRVNTTLTELNLYSANFCLDMHVAGVLLGALIGHPSLRQFVITGGGPAAEDRGAFGATLAALIAADAPALQVLYCPGNFLEDVGLAPIADALPLNRHLRELDVGDNWMSPTFAYERLLPAVRANTTLRASAVSILKRPQDHWRRRNWCAAGGSTTAEDALLGVLRGRCKR
jgi:hypothetical protein